VSTFDTHYGSTLYRLLFVFWACAAAGSEPVLWASGPTAAYAEWFSHAELTSGGELVLKMGPEPNLAWGNRPEDRPPTIVPEK